MMHKRLITKIATTLLLMWAPLCSHVTIGADILFEPEHAALLKGRTIGLITNHTAINREMVTTEALLRRHAQQFQYTIAALFAPEHGITGASYADEETADSQSHDGIPIYNLQGRNRRPSDMMLKGIDLLIYDIQDLGSRSYTYSTTLFYVMEEAAKRHIPIIVLDRPNPINGITIDGPLLEESLRSMVGYINVPYCHGMTIGELARYFNGEYQIAAALTVVPMRGWHREMSFDETGLHWVPTSPQIPEASTALYYPTTGILGQLSLLNIGIGYTLPFKVLGAPWIDADIFADALNRHRFPGVQFVPFHYKPFYGKFAREECHGALITITDKRLFKPMATQYLVLGTIKELYPSHFHAAVAAARQETFHKINGSREIYRIMTEAPFIIWPLRGFHEEERRLFIKRRKQYLIADYR